MGRKRNSNIDDNFHIKEVTDHATSPPKKKKVGECKVCGWKQTYNATRMGDHLKSCNNNEDGSDSDADLKLLERSQINNKNDEVNQTSSASSNDKGSHDIRKQSKITTFIDKVTPEQQEDLDKVFAQAAFHKGLPLDVYEDPYMKIALKKARPGYQPLSSFKLGGEQLNKEFKKATNFNEDKIKAAKSIALMLDGWTNINGKGLINFLLACPFPVLLKVTEKGSERETGEYLGQEVEKIIEEIEEDMEDGCHKIFLIITDNAANMRKMWKIIETKYPFITCIGCAPHCLNLFIKDILKLSYFRSVYRNAKKVVKCFKKSHLILSTFEDFQKEKYGAKKYTLKLPPSTRFGYVVLTFDSIVRNKSALQSTALKDELGIPRDIKLLLCDEDFWEEVDLALKVLRPIARGIAILESDQASLSQVVEVFADIYSTVTSDAVIEDFPLQNIRKIKKIAKERKDFMLKPIHYAANILDPRYCGKVLNDALRLQGVDFIKDFAQHLKLDVEEILANLVEFRTKTGLFASETIWKAASNVHPASWWEGFCTDQPLTAVANKLLRLPPSATGCERNWSSFGKVHNKSRNKLKTPKATKLVTVQSYLHSRLKLKIKKKVALALDFNSSDFIFPTEEEASTSFSSTNQVEDESESEDDYDSDQSELSISSTDSNEED